MNSFDYQVDIAMQCCEILKNFTRMSLDFQRAVASKGKKKIQYLFVGVTSKVLW